jgi:RNA polymerase sigma-70 factor (ECF subfamily)
MPTPETTPRAQDAFDLHLKAGDLRAAGEWLVRAHGRDVLNLCTAMVRDRGTAEDLAQDAFGKAYTALESYRFEASARTWLLTIARHRCLDHLRRQARQPVVLGHEEDAREARAAEDEVALISELLARRADIHLGLAALDETERALVVLRFRHGLAFEELADTFGIKAGAARMRVSRALAKMRDAIPLLDAQPSLTRAGGSTGGYAGAASPQPSRGAAPTPAPPAAPAPARARGAGLGSASAGAPPAGAPPAGAPQALPQALPPGPPLGGGARLSWWEKLKASLLPSAHGPAKGSTSATPRSAATSTPPAATEPALALGALLEAADITPGPQVDQVDPQSDQDEVHLERFVTRTLERLARM